MSEEDEPVPCLACGGDGMVTVGYRFFGADVAPCSECGSDAAYQVAVRAIDRRRCDAGKDYWKREREAQP